MVEDHSENQTMVQLETIADQSHRQCLSLTTASVETTERAETLTEQAEKSSLKVTLQERVARLRVKTAKAANAAFKQMESQWDLSSSSVAHKRGAVAFASSLDTNTDIQTRHDHKWFVSVS